MKDTQNATSGERGNEEKDDVREDKGKEEMRSRLRKGAAATNCNRG